jgi:hypothetical protein
MLRRLAIEGIGENGVGCGGVELGYGTTLCDVKRLLDHL